MLRSQHLGASESFRRASGPGGGCNNRSSSQRRRPQLRSSRSLSSDELASLASRLQKQKVDSLLPSIHADHRQAVEKQLKVLQVNNKPYNDHGIEILYRYSNFDPFKRSRYFGLSLDLGQFERFRRMFHTPKYSVLLDHRQHTLVSALKISDIVWRQRVQVEGNRPNCAACFTFTMIQRVGGCFDGIWFCDSLLAEETADSES